MGQGNVFTDVCLFTGRVCIPTMPWEGNAHLRRQTPPLETRSNSFRWQTESPQKADPTCQDMATTTGYSQQAGSTLPCYYCPCSEASEGYFFTGIPQDTTSPQTAPPSQDNMFSYYSSKLKCIHETRSKHLVNEMNGTD